LDKAPDAFRTISEVADEINVPQHVLRFWESRFPQIRPLKRGGGRRYYRPLDVDLLRGVRHLLYGEGYTIRGVQRILREQGLTFVQSVWRAGAEPPPPQLEEDQADDNADIQAALASAKEPSFIGLLPDAPIAEHPRGRREPAIASVTATGPASRLGTGSENRRILQSVVDDLIGCRRLLDAALAEASLSED
jgi:DNA-binding transcriptional MerR regulator